jgi:hypothetical protein
LSDECAHRMQATIALINGDCPVSYLEKQLTLA